MHHNPSSHRARKPVAAVGALALGLASLAACGGSTKPAATKGAVAKVTASQLSSVTLRVGDQDHLAEDLLQKSGALAGVKYKIDWSQYTAGPPMVEAITGNALDIGGVGDTPPAFAAAAKDKVAIVAASEPGGDANDNILVPKGSSVTSVKQLAGKTVAVDFGSSGQYMLLAALKAAGMKWTDIHAVNTTPPDALAALSSGKIDAWAVWYPFAGEAVSEGAKIIESGEKLDPGYDFEVASTQSLASPTRSAAIADFLHRLSTAQVWEDSHAAEWAQDYASATGLSLAEAKQMVAITSRLHYVDLGPTVTNQEQTLADAFSSIGLIPATKMSAFVDTQFNADTVK